MRFGKPPGHTRAANSKVRMQVVRLVGLLLLVLIATRIASKPGTWDWMFPGESAAPEAGSHEPSASGPADQPVEVNADVDEGVTSDPTANRTSSDSTPRPLESKIPPNDRNDSDAHVLDAELLNDVEDDTLGVRHAEASAFYKVLAFAHEAGPAFLNRVGRRDVSYAQLIRESEHLRGTAVTLEGEVKRLVKLPPADNEHGLADLYEAWLVTADSGANLYRIVCTSVSDGLPQGSSIDVSTPVRVTGFFFKRQGYASQSGLDVAPLLLAAHLEQVAPVARTNSRSASGSLAAVVVGAVLILCFYVWKATRVDWKFRRTVLHRSDAATAGTFDALKDVEPVPVADALRKLAERKPNVDSGDELGEPKSHDGDESL